MINVGKISLELHVAIFETYAFVGKALLLLRADSFGRFQTKLNQRHLSLVDKNVAPIDNFNCFVFNFLLLD